MILLTCPHCSETHILLHRTTNTRLVRSWYWQVDQHVTMCAVIKKLEGVLSAKSI